MKKSIGSTLKTARKNANMTVDDIAYFLSKNGISVATKTIYGWENDSSKPSVDIFLLLCNHYGMRDILETFGYTSDQKIQPLRFKEHEYTTEELDDILKYAEFVKSKRNK